MNLALVASSMYCRPAINLIESYRVHYPNGRILYCYFGPMDPAYSSGLQAYYGNALHFRKVTGCQHAEEPGLYFFKVFAVREAMKWNEPFIYLDSMAVIHRRPVELEHLLLTQTRAFAPYPHVPFFRNDKWTTTQCFAKMSCNQERFKAAYQYAAGLQCYAPTAENVRHIEELFELMRDRDIAGPSNIQGDPDGNGLCVAHRNDQSVLSILIERNGWQQPFDMDYFPKYGDVPTIEGFLPDLLRGTSRNVPSVITHRGPHRNYDYAPFVPADLRARLP